MKKILYLMLGIFLISFLTQQTLFVKAEETDSAFSSLDSYTTRSFKDLYDEKILDIDDSSRMTIDDTESDGIKIAGNSSNLNDVTFTINKTFHFDGNRVGRVALNALAAKGQNLTMELYLDDETTSFATFDIVNQSAASIWSKSITINEDVLANNIEGDHKISFRIISEDSGAVVVLLRSIEFVESDLPTIYMDLDESLEYVANMNSSKTHSVECYGSMSMEIPKGYTYEYGDQAGQSATEDITETYDLSYIRGRGNSTWELNKKPYKLKLNKKARILGMSKDKNWALVANRYDNTKLRNKITYWLGEQLNIPFTPKSVPVDVVVNGIYYGSYYISETIRVSDERVAIDDLEADDATKESTDESVITGGYLLSYDSWGTDANEQKMQTKQEFKLAVQSPSFDGYLNETQLNYIKDYVQKTEDALYGDGFKDDDGVSYTEYMDLDSAVDYYLVEEFSMNDDGYSSGSNYLYKKRNGKLYWGPLWDFDFAYNNDNRFDSNMEKLIHSDNKTWVDQMIKDPVFCNRLVERWSDFRTKLLEAAKDGGQIDKYYDNLLISERYDMELWGFKAGMLVNYKEYPFTTFEEGQVTYKENVERLKTFINNRVQWFDSILDSFRRDPYTLTLKTDDTSFKTLTCYSNVQIGTIPEAPDKEGYLFKGWAICDENGNETSDYLYTDTILTGNTTAKAVYIAAGNKAKPEKLYLSDQYLFVNVDNFTRNSSILLHATVFPKNAYGTIHYSSNKPDVLSIDQNGIMRIKKLSLNITEVTITVTFGNLQEECGVVLNNVLETGQTFETSEMNIDQTTLKLDIGKTSRINIVYNKQYPAYDKHQWVSLDNSIATVDGCGFVTGVKAGTTKVYLMNSTGKIMRTCKVTVNDPSSKKTVKKAQTITVKTRTKTLRYKRLKKKAQTFKMSASAKTGLTYKKLKGNKKITISSTGRIKVRKKLRKGTYVLRVKISAKATNNYKAASKTVRIKIKVK